MSLPFEGPKEKSGSKKEKELPDMIEAIVENRRHTQLGREHVLGSGYRDAVTPLDGTGRAAAGSAQAAIGRTGANPRVR
jgi:hypothetical protein